MAASCFMSTDGMCWTSWPELPEFLLVMALVQSQKSFWLSVALYLPDRQSISLFTYTLSNQMTAIISVLYKMLSLKKINPKLQPGEAQASASTLKSLLASALHVWIPSMPYALTAE